MIQQRPLLLPFVAMAAALVITDQTGYQLPLSAVAAALLCLLLSALIRTRTFLEICVPLFFFALGLNALSPWKTSTTQPCSIRSLPSSVSVTLQGIVTSQPVVSATGTSLVVRTEQLFRAGRPEEASGDLLLFVSEGDVSLLRGDRVRFTTRVAVPRRLGLPGEFDYPRYLAFQGIAASGRVSSGDDVVLIRGAAEDSLLCRIDRTARRLGDFIRSSVPSVEESSVLTSLLIGDQKRIPIDLAAAYTRPASIISSPFRVSMSVSSAILSCWSPCC